MDLFGATQADEHSYVQCVAVFQQGAFPHPQLPAATTSCTIHRRCKWEHI